MMTIRIRTLQKDTFSVQVPIGSTVKKKFYIIKGTKKIISLSFYFAN